MELSSVLLFVMILLPLVFAALVAMRPREHAAGIATVGMLAAGLVATLGLFQFDWSRTAEFQGAGSIPWMPSLGMELSVGVDSVAMLLVALTALLGPICVIASYTAIREKTQTFYAMLLILQAAMFGVFCARDLVFFYICFEFTLIPMYVMISLFGSTNRKAAATKFFLYTFTGSVIALAGFVYVAWYHANVFTEGEWTLAIEPLRQAAASMPADQQVWVMLAMLAGFAIKVPLFPVHTWLPLAHTEAPTAGSVILAGVLLKLGTYGIYRFVLPFAPAAVVEYAPIIAIVSIIGIVYAGLICWVQTDVKKLVAYSSVSHLGFCVLGLVAINNAGLTGSILYMINHGLSTGALFLLIGMVYERYHTRSMRELGGLAYKMPIWGCFMVYFAMASVGLPGLNGFISEFLCLMGTFQADANWAMVSANGDGATPGATFGTLGPWFALVAGTGMIIAAIYILFMVGKVCFGPLVEPQQHHDDDDHGPNLPTDLSAREIGVLMPLAILCLVFGLYPKPLLVAVSDPVNQTVSQVVEGYRAVTPMNPVIDAPPVPAMTLRTEEGAAQ